MQHELPDFNPSSKLPIRRILPSDLNSLIALGHTPGEAKRFCADSLAGRNETLVWCSADGTLLGSTTVAPLVGSAGGWLAGSDRVHPLARGRGIGKALVEARGRYLRDRGARLILTFIRPDNTASHKISASGGYGHVGYKSEITTGASFPSEAPHSGWILHRIRSRAGLLRAGRGLGWRVLIDGLATSRRPLGGFPPHLAFPQFELQRLVRSAPSGAALLTDHGEVIGVRFQDTIVLGTRRGIDEVTALTAERWNARRYRSLTVYHDGPIQWPSGLLADQWQIRALAIESAPTE